MLVLLVVALASEDIGVELDSGIPSAATVGVKFHAKFKMVPLVMMARYVTVDGDLKVAKNGVEMRAKFTADPNSLGNLVKAGDQLHGFDVGLKALPTGLNVAVATQPESDNFAPLCVQDSWANWQSATTLPQQVADGSAALAQDAEASMPPELAGAMQSVVVKPSDYGVSVCGVPSFDGCIEVTLDDKYRPTEVSGSTNDYSTLEMTFEGWTSHPEPLSDAPVCKEPHSIAESQDSITKDAPAAAAAVEAPPPLKNTKQLALEAASLGTLLGSPHMHALYAQAKTQPATPQMFQSGLAFFCGGVFVAGIAVAMRKKATHSPLLELDTSRDVESCE